MGTGRGLRELEGKSAAYLLLTKEERKEGPGGKLSLSTPRRKKE